ARGRPLPATPPARQAGPPRPPPARASPPALSLPWSTSPGGPGRVSLLGRDGVQLVFRHDIKNPVGHHWGRPHQPARVHGGQEVLLLAVLEDVHLLAVGPEVDLAVHPVGRAPDRRADV